MTRAALVLAAALLLVPAGAHAQAPAASPERWIDLALGGTFLAPAPAGSSTASLIAPSGSRLTLFDVESRYGIGYGADAGLGFRLSPRLWLEARGSWAWTSVRSRISDDVENAPSLTITETIARLAGEGAVLWYFADRGTTSFFLRGGGGWMRELAGGNSLVEDGIIGTAGAGLRHWWRQTGAGAVKRMGLRLEGRVLIRTGGLEFGSADLRITPAASGLLIVGF
jgi:hypothetical protein